MVDVNVHALARQDNLNVVPFPVMNSRWSLVLGKKIPEKNSARLGRVLQTARILRACAAWPDIEGFERVVVALPQGQAGSHCQGLYVKFDRAVTQSYAFASAISSSCRASASTPWIFSNTPVSVCQWSGVM